MNFEPEQTREMIAIPSIDFITTMSNGGLFKLFTASTEKRDLNTLDHLWEDLLNQVSKYNCRKSGGHIIISTYSYKKWSISMPELYTLIPKILDHFNCTHSYGMSSGESKLYTLNIIVEVLPD